MFLLKLLDGDRSYDIALFESLESGRSFIKQLPGYQHRQIEDGGYTFEEESISVAELPDFIMLEHKAFRLPFSRFSFEEDVTVIWIELDYVDDTPVSSPSEPKLIQGATRVDAYSVNNEEVEAYIRKREEKAALFIKRLHEIGYEVSRECFGSEDGEVLFIRKKDGPTEAWRFFTHLDPGFVEGEDIEAELLTLE